jgi:hypothetical protein
MGGGPLDGMFHFGGSSQREFEPALSNWFLEERLTGERSMVEFDLLVDESFQQYLPSLASDFANRRLISQLPTPELLAVLAFRRSPRTPA